MSEELIRALSFIGVGVVCFIIGMVVEFVIDQGVINRLIKDSTDVMNQAIKDKLELSKLKEELKHRAFHSDVHTHEMIQRLQDTIAKKQKLIDKYKKELPICELYKDEILKLKAKGLTSDEIGEKIGVTGSTVRKYWNK